MAATAFASTAEDPLLEPAVTDAADGPAMDAAASESRFMEEGEGAGMAVGA